VAFATVKSEVSAGGPPLGAQVHGYQAALQVGIFLALLGAAAVIFLVKNHKVDPKEAMMAG